MKFIANKWVAYCQPIFLAALLLLAACRVQIVPEYSASLYEQIVNGAKANDKLYLMMLASGEDPIPHQKYAEAYVEVAAEINSIRLKNLQREKNVEMLKIIDNLKTTFDKYQNEHRTRGLTHAEATINQSTIQGFWLPLLKAEGGLQKVRK